MYGRMNIEDELYQLRPMNCHYHILIFKRKLHSYQDFPIQVAFFRTVYRYELSGSFRGLLRVRGFTQDDAHIFCLSDQIKDEIWGFLDLMEEMLLQFGFSKYEVNLSTSPEKAVRGDDIWEKTTSSLKEALDDKGWSYQIDEGGGAFYGPKIDLIDALEGGGSAQPSRIWFVEGSILVPCVQALMVSWTWTMAQWQENE